MTIIALLGATGTTGRRVLDRALAAGYDVRALVRHPAKLDRIDPSLTVVMGDVLDLADFLLPQIDDRTYVHQMPFVSA